MQSEDSFIYNGTGTSPQNQLATNFFKFNQLATQLEATLHIRNVNSPQCSQLARHISDITVNSPHNKRLRHRSTTGAEW